MKPTFFATPADFRTWLAENHDKCSELLVGYYKVNSGKPSMSWSESVDQALCFGWIDGIRRSLDKDSYTIRFTPRKPRSIWSAVNLKKVEELSAQGLMAPAGLAAFSLRMESHSSIYSYEKAPAELSEAYWEQFKANPGALAFFQSMAPSYQRTAIHWVMSAKQETTRDKRMAELIRDCAAGKKIKPLSY